MQSRPRRRADRCARKRRGFLDPEHQPAAYSVSFDKSHQEFVTELEYPTAMPSDQPMSPRVPVIIIAWKSRYRDESFGAVFGQPNEEPEGADPADASSKEAANRSSEQHRAVAFERGPLG